MKKYREKLCTVCQKPHNRRGVTCSSTCAALSRKMNSQTKLCEYCGKEFKALHHFDRFCEREHQATCGVCSKRFIVKDVRRPASTCSSTCAAKASHSEESRKTRERNSLKKWGVASPLQAPEVKAKIAAKLKARGSPYGLRETRYGVKNAFLLPGAVPGRISSINRRWKVLLEEATGLEWQLEKTLPMGRTVDLYLEHQGKRIALEPHPTATHNAYKNLVACNRRGCSKFPCGHAKDKGYHQERSKALHETGIQLISVFDWMPQERVIAFVRSSLGLNSHRIGARKTELKRISQAEANRFLKEFHMLGGSKRQEYSYGLYYRGDLIQVQTFARLKDSWEARRLATRDDYQVIGGVSRGTKAFIQEAKPERIVAFSDLSLSWPTYDGEFNGFGAPELQPPVLCWSKGSRMVLDKSAAFQSADRLIGLAKSSKESPYPETMSNREVFLAEGWLPVWDCGKIKQALEL